MSEDDCGATFALPVAEDMEVVPVTIDVTDDAMNAILNSNDDKYDEMKKK